MIYFNIAWNATNFKKKRPKESRKWFQKELSAPRKGQKIWSKYDWIGIHCNDFFKSIWLEVTWNGGWILVTLGTSPATCPCLPHSRKNLMAKNFSWEMTRLQKSRAWQLYIRSSHMMSLAELLCASEFTGISSQLFCLT